MSTDVGGYMSELRDIPSDTPSDLPSDPETIESLGGFNKSANKSAKTDTTPAPKLGNTGNTGTSTSIEERALQLLGNGVNQEVVASALGVTAARISQLVSNEEFANKVATLRYQSLQSHSVRDSKYDSIEDLLLAKLETSVPLMFKPETLLKAINVVNGAKRRGATNPTTDGVHRDIVSIVMPVAIMQQFVTNINNQVIRTGEQELVTIQSGTLLQNTLDKRKEVLPLDRLNPQLYTPKESLNVQEQER